VESNYCSVLIAGSQSGVQLLQCITDGKNVVSSQADGQELPGFALVPETVQVIRAEFLQEMLCAGKELQKAIKIRGCLERRMSSMQLTMTIRNRQYNLQILKVKTKRFQDTIHMLI